MRAKGDEELFDRLGGQISDAQTALVQPPAQVGHHQEQMAHPALRILQRP